MRFMLMLMMIASFPAMSHARIALPEPQVRLVDAWVLPVELGTPTSAVGFTANTDVMGRLDESILLGKIDFTAGGPNTAYMFTARVEITGPDMLPRTVELSSEMAMIGIAAGPVNAQGLFMGMMPILPVDVDGTPYGLKLIGVTETPELRDMEPFVAALNNDETMSGYLWGTVTPNMSSTENPLEDWDDVIFQTTGGEPQDHCHQTPEPSTWVFAMFAIMALCGMGYWKRRRLAVA